MTPEQLGQIIILTIVVIIGRATFGNRAVILAWIMSRRAERKARADLAARLVLDRSEPTSMTPQTTLPAAGGLNTPGAGLDAETWEMPRISAYLDDTEFIVMLARQKLRDGHWRLSANRIVQTVGGDRTTVLRIVREVREGIPEFRPITPEQAAVREGLGLSNRQNA